MKRDWMENWKTNLYTFLGIFLAYLLVYLTQMNALNSSHAGYYYSVDRLIGNYCSSFGTVFVFFMFVFATYIMNNMQTKEARFSYLMLPGHFAGKVRFASFVCYGRSGDHDFVGFSLGRSCALGFHALL